MISCQKTTISACVRLGEAYETIELDDITTPFPIILPSLITELAPIITLLPILVPMDFVP